MDVMDVFNNMAFPLAMCLAMGWYVKYITDMHNSETNELNQHHRDAEEKLSDAINNNTLVMTKLCERITQMVYHEESEDKHGSFD